MVTCRPDQRPIVIITSNGYLELSGPFRRRCNYLYLRRKKTAEMAKILALKANADRNLALGIVLLVSKMTNLHYQPSLAEAIDYAKFLSQQEDILNWQTAFCLTCWPLATTCLSGAIS
ncbi:hypothetical protein VST16_05250 [Lactobacillus delbrueckii subsp. lactis]|jgi:MoxR-like ATPase